MHFLYNFLIHALFLLGLPVWVFVALKEKYRAGVLYKLGFGHQKSEKSIIMIHGVSVGEINAAYPFVKKMIRKFGAENLLITSSTQTGFANARRKFPDLKVEYFPFDFLFSVRKFFQNKNIQQIFLMETEIWPNFCDYAFKRDIPVYVLNARISDHSFPRFLKYKKFLEKGFAGIKHFFCQSIEDKKRLLSLGVGENLISISGYMKIDMVRMLYEESSVDLENFPVTWTEKSRVIMAGSIHVEEVTPFLKEMLKVGEKYPDIKILLVPRKPAGIKKAVEYLREINIPFSLRSSLDSNSIPEKIIIVDTMGELFRMYAMAEIVFVGKSLFKGLGGQNPLEPAVFAKPVIMGASYENFRGIVKDMLEKNAIRIVADFKSLRSQLIQLLDNSEDRKLLGDNAKNFIFKEQSSCASILQYIDDN